MFAIIIASSSSIQLRLLDSHNESTFHMKMRDYFLNGKKSEDYLIEGIRFCLQQSKEMWSELKRWPCFSRYKDGRLNCNF